MSEVQNVYDLADGELQSALLLQRGRERGLRFNVSERWPTDLRTLESLPRLLDGEILFEARREHEEVAVLELTTSVVMIELELAGEATPTARVDVVAESRPGAKLQVARLKELIPPAAEPESDLITVSFWYRGPRGTRSVARKLEAPSWCDARRNYTTSTRARLEPLMSDTRAVLAGGRLLLWHGAPGTGKTSAVRTLARENRAAVRLEYVLDPESLFGRDAGYFVDVLLNEDDEDGSVHKDKTRLLVLEDCDELLSADAKERAGQGLARLLNLVDGLIGQGLNVGVLITTNAELGGFHPAVSRPGRCGSIVEFELFDGPAAREWLSASGRSADVLGRFSLADLLAIRDGRAVAQPRPIGFVAQPSLGRNRRD